MKYLVRMSFIALCTLLFVTSCTKEEVNVVDVENYTTESVEGIERNCKTGRHGCFEFVFPISIVFPDESTASYDDYTALRAGIKSWKEANPDAEERPEIAFPVEVVGEDGTAQTISSQEELRELASTCERPGGRKDRHRGHRHNHCFKPVFPLSIAFPDGTITEYTTKEDLKTALRSWKEDNPDAEEKPGLSFPVDVEMKESGDIITVESQEALTELKETCSGS